MSESKEPAIQQLNMQRESWCMVEASSRQSWERTQRKHFKQHLRSSFTFGDQCAATEYNRATWATAELEHREKRHFD
ncbi:SPT45 protein, partial [Polypterus senegalus]